MIVVDKIKIQRIILLILITATLAFIWTNSLADANTSTDRSDFVIDKVKPIVDPHDRIGAELFEIIVRKTAHFTEFAVLGAEMFILFSTYERWRVLSYRSVIIPIGVCLACAVTDELLQLTSEGRACRFGDMMIDLGGIVIGTLFIVALKLIINRIKKSHKS